MSRLLDEEALKEWSGHQQRSKLEVWLKHNQIALTFGKGNKLISTEAAVNRALMGEPASANDDNDGFS